MPSSYSASMTSSQTESDESMPLMSSKSSTTFLDHGEEADKQDGARSGRSPSSSHSSNAAVVRDAIIGFADGLTVPFALTAGLSSIGSSHIVILGGLAELFAGAISMGLGAYLACITEAKAYEVELSRQNADSAALSSTSSSSEQDIYQLFEDFRIPRDKARGVVETLRKDPEMWIKFRMHFALNLSEPETSRAWISALVMGLSYFLAGLIPMIPYFALDDVNRALLASIGITVFMLLTFGYVKAVVTGCGRGAALLSSAQTLLVGVLAAGSSYGLVKGINSLKDGVEGAGG